MKKIHISVIVLTVAVVAVVGSQLLVRAFRSRSYSPDVAKIMPDTSTNTLGIETLTSGEGETAEPGNRVSVHYTGWLVDGTKFDSSLDRGTPFTFTLGAGQVIQGWDQGVVGMRLGEKRRLTIPPTLGYGASGVGPIPGNSTLVFEVELLTIN